MESSCNIRDVLGSPLAYCCQCSPFYSKKGGDWQYPNGNPRTPLYWNYFPSFEGFSTLTRECNVLKLKIMESLLIAFDKTALNKAGSSLPLELF